MTSTIRTSTFADQVIAVVGGNKGIGAAISADLARHGATVIVAARDAEASRSLVEAIRAEGGRAEAIACDVTDPDSCVEMVATIADRHGRLDTLFANQGVSGPVARLTEWSAEAVDHTLAVNLTGCLNLARAAQELLAADGGGRFIVTGSGTGQKNLPRTGMYGISKAAVSHLVRQLAVEWRARSVAVNEMIPGPVRTGMTGFGDDTTAEQAEGFEKMAESSREWLKDPEDVAPLARFMAELPPHGPTGKIYNLQGRV